MLHPWGRAGFGWWNTLYSMVNIPADCEFEVNMFF